MLGSPSRGPALTGCCLFRALAIVVLIGSFFINLDDAFHILAMPLLVLALTTPPRFRCTNVRWTGETCGGPGSVTIRAAVLLPVGGDVRLAFLLCERCLPPWYINLIPIDRPPWTVADWRAGDRFRCPGLSGRRKLAGAQSDMAAPPENRVKNCKGFPPINSSRPRSARHVSSLPCTLCTPVRSNNPETAAALLAHR